MSFWGKLFGSDESIKSVIDNVGGLIDDAFYTDAEEAKDKMEMVKTNQVFILDWMKGTQGQNLSRRLIALSTTFTWLFMKLTGSIFSVIGIWTSLPESKVNETVKILDTFTSDMTGAVMLILGFYFAAPHMGSIATAALQRFGQRNDKPEIPVLTEKAVVYKKDGRTFGEDSK